MNAKLELKPCPFCGRSEFVSVRPDGELYDDDREDEGFFVNCDAAGATAAERGCGATAGWGETPEAAIALWNNRAAGL